MDLKYYLFVCLLVCSLSIVYGQPVEKQPITNVSTHMMYDQRQTGRFNIHLSIKDVAIIEIDHSNFQDETLGNADDYYYDEADLTVKPISGWTSEKPSSTGTATSNISIIYSTTENSVNHIVSEALSPTLINSTTVFQPAANNTFINRTTQSLENEILKNLQHNTLHSTFIHDLQLEPIKPIKINDSKIFKFKARQSSQKFDRRCRSGHFRDENGNCRAKRSSSFLRKLINMLISLPVRVNYDDEN